MTVCEKYPWCDEEDDRLAVALLKSKRPARLSIECPSCRRRLAAVYDVPNIGRVLCQPATTERVWNLFDFDDKFDPTDPRAFLHHHAWSKPLPRSMEEHQAMGPDGVAAIYTRCRCPGGGSYIIDIVDVIELRGEPDRQGRMVLLAPLPASKVKPRIARDQLRD